MSYVHLTENERYQIDELQREGFSEASISERLCRSRSTIFRELRRNKGEVCSDNYNSLLATLKNHPKIHLLAA